MKTGQKVVDIMDDGTLIVNTRFCDDVKRVVIKYANKEPRTFLPEKKKSHDERIMNTFLADSRH